MLQRFMSVPRRSNDPSRGTQEGCSATFDEGGLQTSNWLAGWGTYNNKTFLYVFHIDWPGENSPGTFDSCHPLWHHWPGLASKYRQSGAPRMTTSWDILKWCKQFPWEIYWTGIDRRVSTTSSSDLTGAFSRYLYLRKICWWPGCTDEFDQQLRCGLDLFKDQGEMRERVKDVYNLYRYCATLLQLHDSQMVVWLELVKNNIAIGTPHTQTFIYTPCIAWSVLKFVLLTYILGILCNFCMYMGHG